jgi:hypothetical protein
VRLSIQSQEPHPKRKELDAFVKKLNVSKCTVSVFPRESFALRNALATAAAIINNAKG